MSNSKYEYVKDYEIHNELIKNTFIIVRIDGKGFTKFCDAHQFEKPNDIKGIELMSLAALSVMENFDEIFMAYGQSDEFSFAFRKDAELYNRRSEKILTMVLSTFSCSYVFYWNKIFPNTQLKFPPAFDGRIILYPSYKNLRDYFSWRQVDCHINNLYNTTFWALVKEGKLTNDEAHKKLMKTFSKEKNEILFSQFNINYNNIPEVYKKGTLLYKNNFKFDMMNFCEISKIKKNKKKIKENIIKESLIKNISDKISNLNFEKKNTENIIDINIKNEFEEDLNIKEYSENFIKLYKNFKEKNIIMTNQDIIQDNFWVDNNFVFTKEEN